MKYSEIRPMLTTGSIVLFRGKGFASGVIIKATFLLGLLSPKNWNKAYFSRVGKICSHVGMIVADKGRKFIFESTTLNGQNGVQLNLFSEVLKSYKGTIVIRKLHADFTPQEHLALQQFISDNLHKPYEHHIWELIGAATPWHVFDGNNKSYFCSELIAKVYQMWRFLPKEPAAKEYSPESFSVGGDVDTEILFSSTTAWLDEEIQVKS